MPDPSATRERDVMDEPELTCPICGMEFEDEKELFEIHYPDCEAEQNDGSGGTDG